MINIKYMADNSDSLDRYRGLVNDQDYINTLHKADALVQGLLNDRECDTQQEAFDAVFGLLRRDVAEYFNNQPKPMIKIEAAERFGREIKIITVDLEAPGPATSHTIEVYGDALFVDGEQIGGV